MRINVIFCRGIVLLIILVAMTAGSVNAGQRHKEWIIIDSFSFGISSEQTARISVLNCMLADGLTRATANVIALVQLLDTEGAIIAQSSEISIEPGKTRFWDVTRESLPLTGNPGERIQVRPRLRVTTLSMDVEHTRAISTAKKYCQPIDMRFSHCATRKGKYSWGAGLESCNSPVPGRCNSAIQPAKWEKDGESASAHYTPAKTV